MVIVAWPPRFPPRFLRSLVNEKAVDIAERCNAVHSALYLRSGKLIQSCDTSDLPTDNAAEYMDPTVCDKKEVCRI